MPRRPSRGRSGVSAAGLRRRAIKVGEQKREERWSGAGGGCRRKYFLRKRKTLVFVCFGRRPTRLRPRLLGFLWGCAMMCVARVPRDKCREGGGGRRGEGNKKESARSRLCTRDTHHVSHHSRDATALQVTVEPLVQDVASEARVPHVVRLPRGSLCRCCCGGHFITSNISVLRAETFTLPHHTKVSS